MATPSPLSPYTTAPSTPKLSDDSAFFLASGGVEFGQSFSAIPFDWEYKPSQPKSCIDNDLINDLNDLLFRSSTEIITNNSNISNCYSGKITEPASDLKPPPPMPLGASSRDLFSRKGLSKRSVLFGRRMQTQSCDFDYDPFEAAIEISAQREEAYYSHDDTMSFGVEMKIIADKSYAGKKWRLKKLLPFIRNSSSSLSSESPKSSASSSTGSSSSVSGSNRRVMNRGYGYNGCLLGCFGLRNMNEFVSDLVPLSPHHSHFSR